MDDLKIGRDYRVTGRPLQGGEPAENSEPYDSLRYVGTIVAWWEGAPDSDQKTELFWWPANKHYLLFKPGDFQAEELSR